MRTFEPPELRGEAIVLRPLRRRHAAAVLAAADCDDVFTWLPFPRFASIEDVRDWIEEALAERGADRRIPFVVQRAADDSVLGSTSYRDLDMRNKKVEIGSTWLCRSSWGTGSNAEAKLLMMSYAFETWGLERIWLRADNLNVRSQRAHERLGAVKEGVHRHEVLRRDGSWCDSIHYSILRSEWSEVKDRIATRLARRAQHSPR